MTQILLSLQFSLLMVPVLIIGLLVFGSDFKQGSGWIYTAGLVIIIALHLSRRFWAARVNELAVKLFALLAGIGGVWVYQAMHVGYWDERNYLQAVLVSLLSIASAVISIRAQYRCNEPINVKTVTLSAVVIVCSWLLAAYYTMLPLLSVAIILIAFFLIDSPAFPERIEKVRHKPGFRYRYAVFLMSLDMFLVVWDFKVNTEWAFYLASSLLIIFFVLLAPVFTRFWTIVVYLIGVSNFLLAIYYPKFVIYYAHSVWSGLVLGTLIKQLMVRSRFNQSNDIFNLWGSVLLGMYFGYAFYANMEEMSWRGILLIPLILGLTLAPHMRHVRKALG